MKTFLLALTIILASSCLVKSGDFYKCKADLTDKCAVKETDAASTQVTYQLKICDAGKVCPFKSITGATTSVSCGVEESLPVYPGGACNATDKKCTAASDCDPTTNKCKAKKATCDSHDDCDIGKVCLTDKTAGTKSCQNPVADGIACTETDSYECTNGSACFKNQDNSTVCKKLFSLVNGEKTSEVKFTDRIEDNILSFCQSGFSENGICRQLTLKTKTACNGDGDCKYDNNAPAQNGNEEFLQNGAEVTITGSCEAGYSPKGEKYCKKANSSDSLSDYITLFKKILADNQADCHTKERFNCKKVVEDKTLLKDLQTKQVNALFENRFTGAEDCVKSVLFPYFQAPVINKCPKFECATEAKETCGDASGNRFEERKVKINPCTTGKSCNFDTIDFFDTDKAKTEACAAAPAKVANKLPGESCEGPDDCIEVTGYEENKQTIKKYKSCTNNKCDGVDKGKRCYDNNSCKVGSYCLLDASTPRNPENDVCAAQLDKTSTTACKSNFDCKNDLICLASKCVDPFSVAQGESINDADDITKEYACATGFYSKNEKSGKFECAQIFYGTEEKKRVAKGLVTCNYDTNCNYKVVFKAEKEGQAEVSKTTTKTCMCGYNANGQGYCPYAEHDADNLKRFQSITNNYKSSLNNNLHTVHRFAGTDAKKSPTCKNYWTNPAFRNSVTCAIDVLGKFATCEDVDKADSTDSSPTSADTSSTNTMMLNFSSFIGLIIAIALF